MKRTLTASRVLRQLTLLACFVFAAANTPAYAVDDTLSITFTTTEAGGEYAPRNVHAIYVTDTSNHFITTVGNGVGSTRALWAFARANDVIEWYNANPERDFDIAARTGATRSSHSTYNITWNWRKRNGTLVPDGNYKIKFELTDDDWGQGSFNRAEFTITKGRTPDSLGPVTQNGYVNVTITHTVGEVLDVAVSGSLAYVADGSAGLKVVDLSSPSSPVEQDTYILQSTPFAAAKSSTTAYLAGAKAGMQILDMSSPAAPTQISTIDVLLQGDIHPDNTINFLDFSILAQDWLNTGSFLAGDIFRDNTVNYSDLSTLVGNWLTQGTTDYIKSVVIVGDLAYIANGLKGLEIIDISDPDRPLLLGVFPTDGYACGVAVSGSMALLVDGINVYILDVSDSRTPLLSDLWASSGRSSGVAIDGTYGYVANGGSGLAILNLADPEDVALAGSYETPGVAYAVAVQSSVAYIASGTAGLVILSVSTPSAPLPLGAFDTPGIAMNIVVADSKAYIADGSAGLSIIDVTTASAPTLDARSSVPVRSWSAVTSGSQIIIADDTGGLVILGQ